MAKVIRVRDVPNGLHRTLKKRAAREGMSLSKYVKRELELMAERPTMQEWLELVKNAKPIRTGRTAEEVVREMRGR
jgi:hypothetical protein